MVGVVVRVPFRGDGLSSVVSDVGVAVVGPGVGVAVIGAEVEEAALKRAMPPQPSKARAAMITIRAGKRRFW